VKVCVIRSVRLHELQCNEEGNNRSQLGALYGEVGLEELGHWIRGTELREVHGQACIHMLSFKCFYTVYMDNL
jgi:hypothetical protein